MRLAPRRNVERRIKRNACLSFLSRKKSQAQAREAVKDKIHVSKEKDRREENRIPDASDTVRKRKGKGIAFTKTNVDTYQDGSGAQGNPREGDT